MSSEQNPADELDDDLLLDDQLEDSDSEPEPGEVRDDDGTAAEQRRQHILNAWKNAINSRTEYRQAVAVGRMSDYDGSTAYRAAVETFLIAIEPVMIQFGDERWDEHYIDSIELRPPPINDKSRGQSPKSEPKSIDIIGLAGLLELPNPLAAEFDYSHEMHGSTTTKTSTQQVPFKTLDKIVRIAGNALADHGFGVPAEPTEDEWEI